MHILFDLDGTLTDPKEGIINCIQFAIAKLNIDIAQDVNLESCIGPPLIDSFIDLCGDREQAKNAIRFYRERFSTVGLFENKLYAGITACLDQLNERAHSIHVATSKPTIYAQRIIEHFGLSQYFGEVFGSNLDGSLSDKTELLAHIIDHKNLDPKQTVMIGDRSFDIVGARNNGVTPIGVLWGYGTEDELSNAGAEILCSHPDQIYDNIYSEQSTKQHTFQD
jgi:phosphoglycolate phosphatase